MGVRLATSSILGKLKPNEATHIIGGTDRPVGLRPISWASGRPRPGSAHRISKSSNPGWPRGSPTGARLLYRRPARHPGPGDIGSPRSTLVAPYDNVNVPVFMGAGAVSVNVLDLAVNSPNRARPVPEAAIAVVPPETFTVPVPVAVRVPVGSEY
jgi:hypothetical protein